jgi:hypothetical protein
MNEVKIIRLRNGSDVIGFVTEKIDGSIFIMEPMEVIMHSEGRFSGLILKQWLPARLIKMNEASINPDNIVCIMEANEEFAMQYSNSVNECNERMKMKDSMSKLKGEELNEMMEAYNQLANEEHIIH